MAEVFIIAAGPIGSGKSALLGEIEIALRAIGIDVRYDNEVGAQQEKNMTHADWQSELERTKPTVTLVETRGRIMNTHRKCLVLPPERLGYVECGFEWLTPGKQHSCCLHQDHGSPSCSCWCGASRFRAGGSIVEFPGDENA